MFIKPTAIELIIAGVVIGLPLAAIADVSTLNSGPNLRLRIGSNTPGVADRVIFEVPQAGLGSGMAVASDNAIPGGSGVFTTRFELDTLEPPKNGRGTMEGDSSQPMVCITPSTCGANTVQLSTVSWNIRDGDNMELASSFSNSPQMLHDHKLKKPGGLRYGDYVQFNFSNTEFLPAGSYRGTVNFTAVFE